MLYPKNKKPFSKEIFQTPPVEYRDVPFWAWNTAMTREDIDFCLSVFKEMGMGGGFLHSRTGMDIPYLGEAFMELITYAHQKSKELGLRAWLYDEDRWPSGFAGGLVTKNEEYRSRYLVWSPKAYDEEKGEEKLPATSSSAPIRSRKHRLLGVYRVKSSDGYLAGYERLTKDQGESGDGQMWWAYLEICGDNPWFNNQSYVDTLNPKAVKAFLDSTYEAYKNLLGQEFGREVPAIFTDEPQFTPKERAGSMDSRQEVIMPFTDKLPEIFEETYGFDLLDFLPELFYEKEGQYSKARYCYHELVSRLFAESYCRQLGKWCEDNHIALTGHLMKEPLLSSQCAYVGETMRAYAGFQIPGMDLLCDRREMTTAKQVQSAVHQFDREAMISELYGVTNWSFDFRGHKLQGDWQAALGVTVRAPHLAWTSMEGEAKRDYPASIFYQSPWYQEYKLIEDYFARIAVVMSRGQAMANIGVIHPIETCWLKWGTREKTGKAIKELDQRFVGLTDWLLKNCLDFDFISEGLVPELYKGINQGKCRIGAMGYDIILVPWMETIKASTVKMLREWKEQGGTIIFLGNVPSCIDAEKSDEVTELSKECRIIGDTGTGLWEELKEYAQVRLFYGDHEQAEDLLCQMRREGDNRYLFIAHRDNPEKKYLVTKKRLTVRMKGLWNLTVLNPLDGTDHVLEADQSIRGGTECSLDWYDHESLLMMMTPAPEAGRKLSAKESGGEKAVLKGQAGVREIPVESRCSVTLSEPNVLVLDMPEYSFGHEPWQNQEEILRIDNRLRTLLGYPLRTEAWPQPWTRDREDSAKDTSYEIKLRYIINSQVEISSVKLGLEQPEETRLWWNGSLIEMKDRGWYVDRRIRTVELGSLKKGRNELILTRNFHERANLEAVYLLGDFGVEVRGRNTLVTEPVRELDFGDWTTQGLPFYGGNVTYHMKAQGGRKPIQMEVSRFTTPLVRVDVEGSKQGIIAFSPYKLMLEPLKEGITSIDITAFGNRVNTFGALHNTDMEDDRSSPNYWRTEGCGWSYEYCIRPSGILKAPVLTAEIK